MSRPARSRWLVEQLEGRSTPATFTVTTLADAGAGSLRDAITQANANADADTIVFDPTVGGGTVGLSAFDNRGASTADDPQPVGPTAFIVKTPVTIQGSGETITRSGATAFRLFQVTAAGNLTLQNVTLSNGLAKGGDGGGGAAGLGGAVYVQGTLSVIGSTLTGNQAVGGAGYNSGGGGGLGGDGSIVIGGSPNVNGSGDTPSEVNSGFGGGGRAYSSSSGNPEGSGGFGGGGSSGSNFSPAPGGAGGFGGGGGGGNVSNFDGSPYAGAVGGFGGGAGADGVVVSGVAKGGGSGGGAGLGGAVFNQGGTVQLVNSTVTANAATGGSSQVTSPAPAGGGGSAYGAGLFNLNGSVTLVNDTFSGNTLTPGTGATTGQAAGGAVYNLSLTVFNSVGGAAATGGTTATVTTANTIFANSTGGADVANNQRNGTATLTATGPNILSAASANAGGTVAGTFTVTNPQLSPPGGNGGPTQTLAPQAGSPALDAGSNAAAAAAGLATDQRGLARVSNGTVDIGAYETQVTIAVTPASLPNGQVGTPYNQTLTASGAAGPFTFTAGPGSLPPGLSLTAAGVLSGTPTTPGAYNFTVTATDTPGGTGSQAYAVTIAPAPGAAAITPATLPDAAVGTAYNQTLAVSGGAGPFTFNVTAGSLPAGLVLTSAGQVTGTPTAVGTATFTVTATDGTQSPTQAYTLTVASAPVAVTITPAALPDGQVGTAYSQTLTAAGPAGPVTFAVTGGSLPPGLVFGSSGANAAVLTGTPTAAGSFTFTVTASAGTAGSGSQSYTVAVAAAPGAVAITPAALPGGQVGTGYSQALTASGAAGPFTFSLGSGTLPPGVSLSAAGVVGGTPTAAGSFDFTVTATNGTQSGSQAYTVAVAASPTTVTITPTSLPAGQVGAGYAQTLTAAGPAGPFTFAVTAGTLPAGLALAGTGALTGTPTAAGSFAFTVTATAATGETGSQAYTLGVAVAPSAVAVGPATLAAGQVGLAYTQTLTATGATVPYTFSFTGTLPPGLGLFPNGVLAGTPTAAGSFAFTVTAVGSDSQVGSRSYTLDVQPAVISPPPAGGAPVVVPGSVVARFAALGANLRATSADLNGDGVVDYVGVTNTGVANALQVIDGKTLAVVATFPPFEASFTNGLYVSVADLTGTGHPDVIVTPDQGGGPVVVVYDGAKLAAGQTGDAAQVTRFFGIDDKNFRGGARAAAAAVGGTAVLAVSAGFGGGPRIALYNAAEVGAGSPAPSHLIPDFFAFEDTLRNGAYVAVGDLTGDGVPDLAFGGGPSGGPRVRVIDGAKLLAVGPFARLDAITAQVQVANFFSGDPDNRDGVRPFFRDADGDGRPELATAGGAGGIVHVYKAATVLAHPDGPTPDQNIDPLAGVFVG